jgi:predicted naringenin-chalcone synthase
VTGTATIAGLGTAVPPSVLQEDIWEGFFAEHYEGGRRGLAKRIFANAGVRTRQAAVSPLLEDVSEWSTERRMRRYQLEAVPLGKEAVSRALTDAGVAADQLGLFAVCSCTGYATPGLDILLARDMGMASTVQRLFVGHMGCYAALPGLGTVADFVVARDRPALLLCTELTSLHLQPASARADIQQIGWACRRRCRRCSRCTSGRWSTTCWPGTG